MMKSWSLWLSYPLHNRRGIPSSAGQRNIPYTVRPHAHEHMSFSPLYPFFSGLVLVSFTPIEQLFSGCLA